MKKLMLLVVLLTGMVLVQGCGESLECKQCQSDLQKMIEDVNDIVNEFNDPNSGAIGLQWDKIPPIRTMEHQIEHTFRICGWIYGHLGVSDMWRVQGIATKKLHKFRREMYVKSHFDLISEQTRLCILAGIVHIGMSAEEVIASKCRPDDKNSSTGVWGVHEQWIYGKHIDTMRYYYFENGILTSWQN